MRIESKEGFDAAAARANALSDAAEGTPAADELAELIAAIRGWEARREPEGHGPEENLNPARTAAPMICRFQGCQPM